MMKRFSVIFVVLALCLSLCACGGSTTVQRESEVLSSMFIMVESVTDNWHVVYHKDTKVMYVISGGSYNRGNFTVLLNPDGTPQIWSGR